MKGKRPDICYTAAYMSQTGDQNRFTIPEVAADWHELTTLQGHTFCVQNISKVTNGL